MSDVSSITINKDTTTDHGVAGVSIFEVESESSLNGACDNELESDLTTELHKAWMNETRLPVILCDPFDKKMHSRALGMKPLRTTSIHSPAWRWIRT